MEAIGLAASCIQIADVATGVVKHLHSLQTKLKNADRNLQLLSVQIIAIKAVVKHVSFWLEDLPVRVLWAGNLVCDMEQSVDACRTLLDIISEHVSELDGASDPTWKERLKYVWNDNEVGWYRDMLQIHVQALQLR